MVVGDKARFAIEFELDDPPEGVWMIGLICYWICGQRVGDYDHVTSLRDALRLERMLGDRNNRENARLFSVEKAHLCSILADSLFGDADPGPEIMRRAMDERWARHVITPELDVFSGWQVFLIESQDQGRCVYRNLIVGSHFECYLHAGEFDEVLMVFMEVVRILNDWHDQLSSAER
jgi:hypothetical protein